MTKQRLYSYSRIGMKQSEILLLRLLQIRDQYGYELEKFIEEAQMRYWSEIGFSSIYAHLNKLAKEEYISFRYKKEPGSPRRKVYHLEEKGRQALKKGVLDFIESPAPLFPDLHVGVIAAEELLSREEYIRALKHLREKKLKFMKNRESASRQFIRERKGVASVFRRIQYQLEADLKWIAEELGEI